METYFTRVPPKFNAAALVETVLTLDACHTLMTARRDLLAETQGTEIKWPMTDCICAFSDMIEELQDAKHSIDKGQLLRLELGLHGTSSVQSRKLLTTAWANSS